MNAHAQNTEARSRMLAAIRRELKASLPFDRVRNEPHAQHEIEMRATGVDVPANAPIVMSLMTKEALEKAIEKSTPLSLVEQFRRALEAVSGTCTVVGDEVEAGRAIKMLIADSAVLNGAARQKSLRVAVSDAALVQSVMKNARLDVELGAVVLERATASELFGCDVGITGAQWAIAETGTLVLESDAERHRLPSLVPPVHIAVVKAECFRLTLGEVLQAINERGNDAISRTVTFITGSSRTSDIELTLAIGVHGPAELHVVVIENTEAFEIQREVMNRD